MLLDQNTKNAKQTEIQMNFSWALASLVGIGREKRKIFLIKPRVYFATIDMSTDFVIV